MTFAQNVQGPTAGFSPFTLVSDQPATFAERGVVLPLTSPALAGARMRGTAGGSCEFLLPNPSGARGLYVLPWEALPGLAAPSIFDTLLSRALLRAGPPTPGLVRDHALATAAEGAAGPAAAAAARAALAADAAVMDAARAAVVARLTTAMEAPGQAVAMAADTPAGRERRAACALSALAQKNGLGLPVVARRIQDVAALLAPLGLLPGTEAAWVNRAAGALRQLAAELRRRLPGPDDDPLLLDAGPIQALIARIDEAAALCDHTRKAVALAIKGMPALLGAWPERAPGLADLAARPAWAVDGWHRLAALRAVTAADVTTLVRALSANAPSWPAEVQRWSERGMAPPPALPPGRAVATSNLVALGPDPQALAEAALARLL